MSGVSRLVSVAFAVLLAAPACRAATQDGPSPCPQDIARVQGANAADFADICKGVAASLAFLAAHGVQATEPVSIEVSDRLPPEAGPTAAGCYLAAKRRVYLQPFGTFRKAKTWFGVRIDRALFRELAAHEAAHAVSGCHFRVSQPSIQAQEYIAYVAMFSVMPAELRAKALRGVRTEGFTTLDRFTPVLYSFDPMRFGAEAYRHFSASDEKAALIQRVLSGQVLSD